MPRTPAGTILEHVRRLAESRADAAVKDEELVSRYAIQRDEAAFVSLLARHGRLVWGVCRRVLIHEHEAEDAFQATFLVLARRAKALRRHSSVSSFLYGIAYRIAVRMKRRTTKHRCRCNQIPTRPSDDVASEVACRELQLLVDEELNRLPEKYRTPFILCCLQGMSRGEVAAELDWKEGTVSSRVAEARSRLRLRLARRGVALSMALCLMDLASSACHGRPPQALLERTSQQALRRTGCSRLPHRRAPGGSWTARIIHGLWLVSLVACGATMILTQAPEQSNARSVSQSPTHAADHAANGLDRFGDPLPADAVARLGTVEFRHGWYTSALAYSPDGKYLASTGGERGLCLWDAATGKLLHVPIPDYQTYCVAFSRDSRLVAASGRGKTGVVFDVATGREVQRFTGHKAGGTLCVAFSPDGSMLASGGHDKLVRLWSMDSGRELGQFQGFEGSVLSVAFSPDGSLVVGGGIDNTVCVWEIATGRLRSLRGHGGTTLRVAFSPDGKRIAAGGSDAAISLWDVASGQLLQSWNGTTGQVEALAFSPDGKTLASGHSDGQIEIWDPATGTRQRQWQAHSCPTAALAFTPDGKKLTSTGNTRSAIRHWDPQTGRERGPAGGPTGQIRQLAFTSDNRSLLVRATDLCVRRWDFAGGADRITTVGQVPSSVEAMVVPTDSQTPLLATFNFRDHRIRVWSDDAGRESNVLGIHPERVIAMVFSKDAKHLATGGTDRRIRLWDAGNGELIHCSEAQEEAIGALTFSPDGKWLASGVFRRRFPAAPGDAAVRLWDVRTGRQVREFECREDVSGLLISPDGSLLVAGTVADSWKARPTLHVTMWNPATAQVIPLPESVQDCTALAFSADAKLLALGYGPPRNETVVLEIASGQELCQFAGHLDGTTAAAFSRDGKWLATGGYDANVVVFDVHRRARSGATGSTYSPENAWDDLASADAVRAFAVVHHLAENPNHALSVLRKRLRPVPGLDDSDKRALRRYLTDLDNDDFSTRENARQGIEKLGELTEPVLRQALQSNPAPEARRRIEAILNGFSEAKPERLRISRAIMALEMSANRASQNLLAELAKGAPEALLTRQADAARKRLSQP